MNNLIEVLEKMAEREKVSFQKIVDIVSIAIKKTYENQKTEGIKEVAVEFNSDSFYIIGNGLNIKLNSWNNNKKFSYECAKEIEILVKELRKEKEYKYFQPLKGSIVSGTIQTIDENSKYCVVNLGSGLGYWDKKEWKKSPENNSQERIYLGKLLRFLILDVKEFENMTMVFISRNEDGFVEKIFEIEIPEIRSGAIKIENVIRIPGLVSKVILKPGKENERMDLIGTCIGKDKTRIKSILKEMRGERIDLVIWSEDKKAMLTNLLSPSEVVSVIKKSEEDWEIIVPEFRISLILQYSGRIIQKIEDYFEIRIKVISLESLENNEKAIIWNGNISFEDYEINKKINIERIASQKERKNRKH